MKKIIIITAFLLFIFQLTDWFLCNNFKAAYHFSANNLKIISDNLIHNDLKTPLSLIRFYHNKITLTIIEIYTSYLLFWDIKFLLNLFLITGVFGLFCGFLYGYNKLFKNLYLRILVIFMFLFPLLEIVFKPTIYFPIKIMMYTLPYELFSLFGLSSFMSVKKGVRIYILMTLIILLTVWWQIVLPRDFRNFCS